VIALVSVLVTGSAGGCAGISAPPIEVFDMEYVEASPEAVRFDVALEVENRGSEAITLRDFRYTVRTASGWSYTGRRAALATLQSGRRQAFSVPVVLPGDAADTAGDEQWTLTGRLEYLTPGEVARVLYDAGLRRPRVRFSGSGRVPVPHADGSDGDR